MEIQVGHLHPAGIAGVVAAAGLSSRMEAFKPLLPFRGKTVIESSVRTLFDGGAERVFLVTGHRAEEIERLFAQDPDVVCVRNPQYDNGEMFVSVRIGLEMALGSRWILFLPGDVPAADPRICRLIVERAEEEKRLWARPHRQGRGWHPLLLSDRAAEMILAYRGEGGLRGALHALPEPPLEVPVDDRGCEIDINTRDEYRELLRYEESIKT